MLLDQLKLNVKLSDFGAARKLATLDRSRTDNLVGTTYWMSPEVIRGKRRVLLTPSGCMIMHPLCDPNWYEHNR